MKQAYILLLGLILGGLTSCKKSEEKLPDSYVVLVSFDAFRWDYSDLYPTPTFDAMAAAGVKAERLIPSFPTKTFPNHYALATGLYPDHNGIINNSFYASDLGMVYRIGDRDMVENGDSYFGEPIWVTAEEQGMRAASYYWVGSEAPVMGVRPSYWKRYDHDVPYVDRVDQVLSWLKLPAGKRPGLVTLYFDQPDGVGHTYGPEHPETGKVVQSLDSILNYLRTGLAALEHGDQINLIVVSDHGMGPISRDRYLNLYDYMEEEWVDMVIGGNPVYLIDAVDGMEDSVAHVLDRVEGMSAWQQEEMPAHFHYGSSMRFPGIVVAADSLWSIGVKEDPSGYVGGAHGYDPHYSAMHSIFLAEGPAFRKSYSCPAFENVEVYGIIAHVLGLEPAETDGKLSRVSHIFSSEQ